LIKLLSADTKERLERGGQRGFVDATTEPGPEDGDEPPTADPFPSEVDLHQGPLASIPEDQTLAGDAEVVPRERAAAVADVPSTPQRTRAPPVEDETSSSSSSDSSSSLGDMTLRQNRLEHARIESEVSTPGAAASGSQVRRDRTTEAIRRVRPRSSRISGSDTQSEPAGEPEIDRVIGEPSAASVVPPGGWTAAAERSKPYFSSIEPSVYLTSKNIPMPPRCRPVHVPCQD
jgi:hypothetical protein